MPRGPQLVRSRNEAFQSHCLGPQECPDSAPRRVRGFSASCPCKRLLRPVQVTPPLVSEAHVRIIAGHGPCNRLVGYGPGRTNTCSSKEKEAWELEGREVRRRARGAEGRRGWQAPTTDHRARPPPEASEPALTALGPRLHRQGDVTGEEGKAQDARPQQHTSRRPSAAGSRGSPARPPALGPAPAHRGLSRLRGGPRPSLSVGRSGTWGSRAALDRQRGPAPEVPGGLAFHASRFTPVIFKTPFPPFCFLLDN